MSERKVFYEIEKPPKKTEIILVPMEVPSEPDLDIDGWLCMHVFKRTPQRVFTCKEFTDTSCVVCGAHRCFAHLSNKTLYIYDREGRGDMRMCETCAELPRDLQDKIRALRLELNR